MGGIGKRPGAAAAVIAHADRQADQLIQARAAFLGDLIVGQRQARAARPQRREFAPHIARQGLGGLVEGIELPIACAATCSVSISVQRMSVEAAITGDIDMLKLAVLHDPLVGAICTPDEVWQMVDEMVVAQAQWLPQYADAIPAAKARLEKATVKTSDWQGAARKVVRSVEELRELKGAHR